MIQEIENRRSIRKYKADKINKELPDRSSQIRYERNHGVEEHHRDNGDDIAI